MHRRHKRECVVGEGGELHNFKFVATGSTSRLAPSWVTDSLMMFVRGSQPIAANFCGTLTMCQALGVASPLTFTALHW